MKIPSSIWTLLIGIALTLVSLWYGQNHGLLPIAASEEATKVDGLFNTMMTVSTGIFLLVEGILIYCAWKYRRRAGDNTDGPPVEGNVPLEILWTAIPAIIVLGISVYSFDVYSSLSGVDTHSAHQAPITQESQSMPGSAIATTLSDSSQGEVAQMDMSMPAAERPPADVIVEKLDEEPSLPLEKGELPLPPPPPRRWGVGGGLTVEVIAIGADGERVDTTIAALLPEAIGEADIKGEA